MNSLWPRQKWPWEVHTTYRTRFYFASTTFICITYMVLLSYFIHKIQYGYRYMPKIHPGKCGFHSTYSMRFCFTQSTTQTSLSYHISKVDRIMQWRTPSETMHIWRKMFGYLDHPLVCIWHWPAIWNSCNLPYFVFFLDTPSQLTVRPSYVDGPFGAFT